MCSRYSTNIVSARDLSGGFRYGLRILLRIPTGVIDIGGCLCHLLGIAYCTVGHIAG